MNLQHARVLRRGRILNIPSSTELPLPTEFDFEHPVVCARRILSMLSTAADHSLRDCTLSYDPKLKIAKLYGVGVSVLYAASRGTKIKTPARLAQLSHCKLHVLLGTVVPSKTWAESKWIPHRIRETRSAPTPHSSRALLHPASPLLH